MIFDYLSGSNRTRVSPTVLFYNRVEWTREAISATTRTMDRQIAHDPGESGLVEDVAAVVAAVVGGEHSLV